MIDLEKEINLCKVVYEIPSWTISSAYVEDMVHPLTGEPCDGLCNPNPENKCATFTVRGGMPDDITLEVIWHEMAHCLVGMLRGERVLEEHVVYPIGRAMGWIRFNAPGLLKDFAASLPWSHPAPLASLVREARNGNYARLAARVRARAGVRSMKYSAELLAMIDASDKSDEEKAAMRAEIEDMAPDSEMKEAEEKKDDKGADVEETDDDKKAAAKKAADAPEEGKASKKAIGVGDDGERNDAASVAARVRKERDAIEVELDARPDLQPSQKAFARSFDRVDQVKAYVATIPRPATTEPKGKQTPHAAALRGGNGGKGSALAYARTPSQDKTINAAFRIHGQDVGGDEGIEIPSDPKIDGFLVKASTVMAFGDIQDHCRKQIEADRKRFSRGVQ